MSVPSPGLIRSGRAVAGTEVDYYAGIKPVLGKLNFDFGGIYYTYPRAFDPGALAVFRELGRNGVLSESFVAQLAVAYRLVESPTEFVRRCLRTVARPPYKLYKRLAAR